MPLISPKNRYWLQTLSKFLSIQALCQALGIASGIALVQFLNKEQYAYFTIANNAQATLNLLSDIGISTGLLSIGGKVWQDRNLFGRLIGTALETRFYFASRVAIVVLPIVAWLLIKNGAAIVYASLLLISVLLVFKFQLTNTVFKVVLQLHSKIDRLQQIDLISAFTKLVIICLSSLVFLNAAVAVVGSSISVGLANLFLKRSLDNIVDIKAPAHPEYRTEIVKLAKYQAPNAIFNCFQGQIQVWLITLFGNTETIAEVGALGRLTVILAIFNALLSNIILPNFARCQSFTLLRKRYLQITIGSSLLIIIVGAILYLFPRQLLWILGGQYSHLQDELYWTIFNSLFQAVVQLTWFLNFTKGWIKYAWLNIPITIGVQIVLLMFINVSTVKGVILFSLISSSPWLLINLLTTYAYLHKIEHKSESP
ncbi:MAG: polysaccharide biosynthesis protein [Cyanosarcina radialis HA8281-LM2]|jgi:O-antigen/teichoic acid export membrane protein|nr:polysaccharide biosynthesis protein [Cyanosarcina radialis HA8281-LM2]